MVPLHGLYHSYCNKNSLCRLQREIDPSSCYVLPEDSDRLEAEMDDGNAKLWVLKHDGHNLHLHAGTGITYINSKKEIPDMSDGTNTI